MKYIEKLIKYADWRTLMRNYSPKDVISQLTFSRGLRVADKFFLWDHKHDEVVNYVIELFLSSRKNFTKEWNKDWKNDIYLSQLCYLVLRYDEVLYSCRRAYELQLPDPPARVLFSYANCYFLPPDVETISQDEAIELFKKAAKKELTIETASLLRDLYYDRRDEINAKCWDTMAQKAENHNAIIVPDVFKEEQEC